MDGMILYGCIMGYLLGALLVALILSVKNIPDNIVFPLCIIWPITFIVWLASTIIFGIKQLPKVWKQ